MESHPHEDETRSGTDGPVDERPTGPADPTDPYPQPVQEIVDPNDPEPLDDRPRTDISGHREPHGEES